MSEGEGLSHKKNRRLRIFGKILFILYIAFIVYFLLFSDLYGRTGVRTQYSYNLVLFKEIKRFWQYREQLGFYAVASNLLGNVLIFVPFGFFLPMASTYRNFFSAVFYSFSLSLCVGGAAGYLVFVVCAAIRRRHVSKKSERSRG